MNQILFTFDVIKLRVSPEAHQLYSGYKFNENALYRTLDEAKAEAVKTAKSSLQASDQTVHALEQISIEELVASNTASVSTYFTQTDSLGNKTDIILTVRALASDSDTANTFYTYHLAMLGVPAIPSEKRLYDTVTFQHGSAFTEFEAAKSAVLKLCEDKRYADLYEQVWGMSKDVTNIGKWRKSFKESLNDGVNGLRELRLNVFRIQAEK